MTGAQGNTRRSTTRVHAMPFGARLEPSGLVRFALWAPSHAQVGLLLDSRVDVQPMRALDGEDAGWHACVAEAAAGAHYRFVLPDGTRVPDPASRHQPHDVQGPSEVIDPAAYRWHDTDWRGRRWEEAVIVEIHVGAFTPQGTFRAAIDRLDHLVSLGATAIELMPVADFPGACNWGYDGVLPFAPDARYGRPEDLKALVEAAHARGLMVLLDVVYNHFGPEGAYIHGIAPEVFTDRRRTPWGAAIDFDGPHSRTVRAFFIHNALYWLDEFHLDGLRFDAVHAILDEGPRHFLDELAARVRGACAAREVHLILENEENAARLLERDGARRPLRYTAQWNDDVHHALHVAASGESIGYYADYHGHVPRLARALAEGFAFQGEPMPYRGHARGEPSAHLPPTAFVSFIQNHDQIGNRAFGDRLGAIAPAAAMRAISAVYLLLPQIPMLFMGEEWDASTPFPFFCDFGDELAAAVREGRRAEFARFPAFADPRERERIPDPVAPDTFASAKLDWDERERAPHAQALARYRRLLEVRHREIVPRLSGIVGAGRVEMRGEAANAEAEAPGVAALTVRWAVPTARDALMLDLNLGAGPVAGFGAPLGRCIWIEGDAHGDRLGPWAVRWWIDDDAGPAR
ncbi:MAG: malto-oligosyltrehalose trehalohydrolase [Lautropia sp.]